MMESWLATSGLANLYRRGLSHLASLEESFFFKRAGASSAFPERSFEVGSKVSGWTAVSWILLSILVVGAVFVPRFSLGGFSRYYSLDLKIEDLALAALMLLFFIFQPPNVYSFWRHAVATSFLCFLIAAVFSIAAGMIAGTLDKPLMSILYLVKWFEYFWVFYFSAKLSQAIGPRRMVYLFFWMGIVLAVYGYYEHFAPMSTAAYPNYYRLYERPPFHGDANHIGGILAMWLTFFSFLYLRLSVGVNEDGDRPWTHRILFVSIFFVLFPLIWTFSRKSYLAFAGAYLVMFFLVPAARRRWVFLGCLIVCTSLLLPTRLAERVSDLGAVMSAVDPYHSSWAGNVDVWKRCFLNFDQFLFFGAGLGARHRLFYESQYVMTLTETGLFGLGTLCITLLLPAFFALRRIKLRGTQGLLAGAWLSAWGALMLHNLSCVSLTVSKCAIVWWFLTGAFVGGLNKETNA